VVGFIVQDSEQRSAQARIGGAPLKAALVGAGQIARQHLTCLQGLTGVEIVAVCDLSPAVARSAAERHGARAWFTEYSRMLREAKPDVVHVTTPPTSHFRLATEALEAGAHVIVEKPATTTLDELQRLSARAGELGRVFIEDYNYVFSLAPRQILDWIGSGEFGAVVHVDVRICLNITGPGGFGDPNAPHPCLTMAGGAIADFLPHLASLAHAFVGAHRTAHTIWTKRTESLLPYDEFQAIADCERGTAALGFSSSSQPDAFWLRVYGERMQATANLFETRLTTERVRSGPKPLQPLFNGLEEGSAIRKAARSTLMRKFRGGPGSYDGLFELLTRTYRALADGSRPPVDARQILEVNRLVDALKPAVEGSRS
jgi:predicted dehydrogenase